MCFTSLVSRYFSSSYIPGPVPVDGGINKKTMTVIHVRSVISAPDVLKEFMAPYLRIRCLMLDARNHHHSELTTLRTNSSAAVVMVVQVCDIW